MTKKALIIALFSAILIVGMLFIWDNPMKGQKYSISTSYGKSGKTFYCKEYTKDSDGCVHFYDNCTKDSATICGTYYIQTINK